MKVMFVVNTISKNTGGEIYQSAIYQCLNDNFTVRLIREEDIPRYMNRNVILRNIWFLGLFMRFNGDIIFQESYIKSSLLVGNLLTKVLSRKRILALSQSLYCEPNISKLRKFVTKIIKIIYFKSVDLIIANSEFAKEEIIELGIYQNKIKVISPSFVQHYLCRDNLDDKVNEIEDVNVRPILLCVANLKPLKGQEYLIKAVEKISHIDFDVLLVGMVQDKEYFERICQVSKTTYVSDRIHFLGHCKGDELRSLYSNATVFVLPSLYESYGMVLHEAMAFGLPIIASNVGGIPEIITEGVNGILVPPGNPEALSKAIIKLLEDPEIRKRMEVNNLQKVQRFPALDEICQEFVKVLSGFRRNR